MKKVRFIVPAMPPSLNEAYGIAGKRKYLRSHARDFKKFVKSVIPNKKTLALRRGYDYFEMKYRILINSEDFFEADKSLSKFDVTNSVKLLEDAVFETMGDLDDRNVQKVIIEKLYTHVNLQPLKYTNKPYRKKVWHAWVFVELSGIEVMPSVSNKEFKHDKKRFSVVCG